MAVSKVAYDGHTLIDLTQDTAVESDVADGKYFHKSNGERVQGTSGKVIVQGSDSSAFLIRPTAGETLAPLDCDRKSVLKKLGNTVCVNQLVPIPESSISTTVNDVILTDNRDGTYTINGTANGRAVLPIVNERTWTANHKYLLFGSPSGAGEYTYSLAMRGQGEDTKEYGGGAIWDPGAITWKGIVIYVESGVSVTNVMFKPRLIDLTLWFGSNDRIPSDLLSHPENWGRYYAGSLAYAAGYLDSADGTVLKSIGRNLWDEEWEQGGFDPSTGSPAPVTSKIRSANFCECIPNIDYCGYVGVLSWLTIWWYDTNKDFISSDSKYTRPCVFKSPSNARYFKISTEGNVYGGTYLNDITISLYYPGESGYDQYYPYQVLAEVDTGSEVLRSAGAVADEKTPDGTITRRVGVVDLSQIQNRISYDAGLGCWVVYQHTGLAKFLGNTETPNIQSTEELPIYYYGNKTNAISIDPSGYILYGNGSNVTKPTATVHYELATPTTEQGTAFTGLQKVDGHGIEMVTGGTTGIPVPFTAQYLKTINAAPTDTIVITENGSHDVAMYAGALVEVSGGGTPSLQSKTVNLDSNAPSTVYPGTGYNGLSSVSFNTAGINAANIKAGTSVCGVPGTAEAEFHHSVTLSIKFVNNRGNTKRIYYMDRDVNDVTKVIWTSQPINADGVAHTVTFPVVATPIAGGTVRPILYVEGWDGAAISDVTTVSGLVPYSVEYDDAQGTGSEMFVIGVISATATLVIDNNY